MEGQEAEFSKEDGLHSTDKRNSNSSLRSLRSRLFKRLAQGQGTGE